MNARGKFQFLSSIVLAVLLWLTTMAYSFSQDYLFDLDIINVEDGLPYRRAYAIVTVFQ